MHVLEVTIFLVIHVITLICLFQNEMIDKLVIHYSTTIPTSVFYNQLFYSVRKHQLFPADTFQHSRVV